MAFTRGEPSAAVDYAKALDDLVALHGAETIAAVIVEPFAGSAGVFPPPKDYLASLRSVCDRYGILLVFDEVITGFGRVGHAFAAERYGVVPDVITFAKGVTNGAVPMGGVIVSDHIRSAFVERADHAIELFHGHTYSAHPLACAAGLATLAIHRSEDLNGRARRLERVLENAVHELRGAPRVIDIRNVGVAAGIEIESDPKAPGRRGYEVLRRAFEDEHMVLRVGGDTVALAPALIASDSDIARMVEGIRSVLERLN
jgi:beta-alanine--pyruvate transaminase